MNKIWQKKTVNLLQEVEIFTVGDDHLIDMHIVKQDIMGSIAHSRMLNKIGVLNDSEQKSLEKELKNIFQDYKNEKFTIQFEDEDVHTKIEKILTEKLGETAKKIHTARSRNDQVLTDLRLYSKEKLITLRTDIEITIDKLLLFAEQYKEIPMCGYTHMQRAMPSSVAQWTLAFVEELLDAFFIWDGVYQLINACPLGSGAGFGVSLNIDRVYTSEELGFDRVQINPIYCQNSRGKTEAQVINYLSSIGLIVNKIANDLVVFTTAEFGFFKVDESITTGSSIMPQKRNLDVMELVRGRVSHLLGLEIAIKNLTTNLISGYHRDLQETKKMIITAFTLVFDFLSMIRIVFEHITPIKENLLKALDKTVFATDFAYEKVKEGLSFREAYRLIGENLDLIPMIDPLKNILEKKHLGATGNLGIEQYQTRLQTEKDKTLNLIKIQQKIAKHLLGEER